VAVLALTSCSTVDSLLGSGPKPSASLEGVRFGDVSFPNVGLEFDVSVTNPYDIALPLVNLEYGLTAGSSKVLSDAAPLQGTIPAHQAKTLTLPVSVSILDVVNFTKGVRPGNPIPYSADGKLYVDAPVLGKIGIPIGKSGELSVPSVPGL
jgi:hypothetical protein